MANALCLASINCIESPARPSAVRHPSVFARASSLNPSPIQSPEHAVSCAQRRVPRALTAKATGSNQNTKPNSIVCADCDGNGAVQCSQCKGTGVNSVDHFNGQFKAGASCWLCRGKKEILCGNCNGAGFLGGFMSTFDQ